VTALQTNHPPRFDSIFEMKRNEEPTFDASLLLQGGSTFVGRRLLPFLQSTAGVRCPIIRYSGFVEHFSLPGIRHEYYNYSSQR
jgi:hypothetical protein